MTADAGRNTTAIILDGYVDEPACLGVPPYISPYIRTVAGMLITHGFTVRYFTIDQLRNDPQLPAVMDRAGLLVAIAGVTVPGKYLGGTPATLTELRQVGHMVRGPKKLIGGPIGFGYAGEGGKKAIREQVTGFDALLTGDPAVALDRYLGGGEPAGVFDYTQTDPWSVAGAGIITQHPDFPYVMCELETARGCSHGATGGCSFCTEPFYGRPRYRSVAGVVSEVAALAAHGARHFRVGRQPDILAYGAGEGEYPAPGRIFSKHSSPGSVQLRRISGRSTSTTRTRPPLPGTRRRAGRCLLRSSGTTRPGTSPRSGWRPPIRPLSRQTTLRHSRMRFSGPLRLSTKPGACAGRDPRTAARPQLRLRACRRDTSDLRQKRTVSLPRPCSRPHGPARQHPAGNAL